MPSLCLAQNGCYLRFVKQRRGAEDSFCECLHLLMKTFQTVNIYYPAVCIHHIITSRHTYNRLNWIPPISFCRGSVVAVNVRTRLARLRSCFSSFARSVYPYRVVSANGAATAYGQFKLVRTPERLAAFSYKMRRFFFFFTYPLILFLSRMVLRLHSSP